MMTYQTALDYIKAQPFRPFRIHLASGRTFDVRHPEMMKVLKSHLLIFSGDTMEAPEAYESVSLMLTESISHLESPVH